MNRSRKEKPSKYSPFVEKWKFSRSTRIKNENEILDDTFQSTKSLVVSTPKKVNTHIGPLHNISHKTGSISSNSSRKRYHKNYDPDIEIRQVNERLSKRLNNSWADQSILNDEEEEDFIKYSEKLRKHQKNIKLEDDTDILARRQNDIDKGKSKQCYKNYVYEVAKEFRKTFQPRTPNKFLKISRRGWDGLVRKWKKHIHAWNEPKFEELYAAGILVDCCNSDVASIASFKESPNDSGDNKDIEEVFSEEEKTLQGAKTRKRILSPILKGELTNNTIQNSLPKLVEQHSGLTNDAAALNMNSKKRRKLSEFK